MDGITSISLEQYEHFVFILFGLLCGLHSAQQYFELGFCAFHTFPQVSQTHSYFKRALFLQLLHLFSYPSFNNLLFEKLSMDNSFLHTKRLLLVDDEQELLKMVSDILKDAGFETVLTAMTVKEAILTAKEETPDLIVLDVMLPDGDGFSLMQHFRTFTNVPIIFLTAKDEAADKLSGLGLGADDYISKPFMPQELLLRIYAVLRRTYKEDSPLLVLDGCTIDFSRAEVHKGSEIISLTAKEHTLLETLARNAGKIVTVDALCEALWGDNPFGYENSLNAHVRRVREKIETDPSKPVSLITIKGLGYKLIARK